MPIWFELLILMLVTYVIGLGIGWMLWGRSPDTSPDASLDTDPDLGEETK